MNALARVIMLNRDTETTKNPQNHSLPEPAEDWPILRLREAIALDARGDVALARTDMARLAQQFPSWSEPWLRLADSYRQTNALEQAEPAYREVLEREPTRVEALVALGAIMISRGEPIQAQSLLIRACGRAPERAEAWHALGLALMATKDARAAESAFAEARRLDPTRLDYAIHAAKASISAERVELELARVELEVSTNPDQPPLHVLHGLLLQHVGRNTEAIDAFETATILAPDNKVVASLLGHILARTMRTREAEAVLRHALVLDPEDCQVRHYLAPVLMRLHRPHEASALLESLPSETIVLCNLAGATSASGMQDQAIKVARRAIAADPDSTLAHRTLANVMPYAAGVTGLELRAALEACAATLPRGGNLAPSDPRPERSLRIGLLSNMLRTHPVGWLTVAGFEALDREAFSITCFGRKWDNDPMTRRFATIADDWVECDQLDDAATAALIREKQIDVLIDLGGYGDTGRISVCAHRAAPVQVKWVGMQCHTTGLPEMDWLVTDRWETPADCAGFYTERLLTLPDGYVCYSPPGYAPPVGELPRMRNGHVTFGCFNNLAKITPDVIATWSRILHAMPDSRLILKTQQFIEAETCEQVQRDFTTSGISEDRVETRGPSNHRAFVNEYNRVDIVLDPFPYSGGLTTCEALWMGVPTITMPGETFASRHSLSHLSNVGLAAWAVADSDAYVRMAIERAGDVIALADLRAGLRARVRESPLCDSARFGKNLGNALRHAWRVACDAAGADR